jgi:hypothetical protein
MSGLGVVTYGYLEGGSGGPDTDSITSVTPVDRRPSRWEPIVIVADMPSGDAIFLALRIGGNRFMIYDPSDSPAMSAMFQDRSSVVTVGTTVTATLLPNGGWWEDSFKIVVVSGGELTA